MSEAQTKMQRLLDAVVADGSERGIQLAAYHRGDLVVDAWAGVLDPQTARPVRGDTLFPVFSVGKGLVATLIHLLVEEGKLDYDVPVASVWPEFAENGKGHITVRQAISHMAGLQHMPMGLDFRDLANWRKMCSAIARSAPAFPPGTDQAYHGITFGWIVGEIASRAGGLPFPDLLRERICRPLGLQNLFIGMPESEESRVASLEEVVDPAKETAPVDDSVPRVVPGWLLPIYGWMNRRDARGACVPASSGIMTARDIARHYAALLPGGVDGIELLPPRRIQIATEQQLPTGLPLGQPPPIRMSLGYFLGPSADMGSRASSFGHGGYGGSMAFADPEQHLAVGLTKNLFSPRAAQARILAELRVALGIPQ